MLTEKQVNHFQTFGFLNFRKLFTPNELKILNAEFEHVFPDDPSDCTKSHGELMLGPQTPFFLSLLEDPRFCGPAEQLYGEDVLGIICDAIRYVGDTIWHADHHVDSAQDFYGVKFIYYLQPATASSGALRIIPGSYQNPFHSELRQNMSRCELDIGDVPCHVCETEPGDVIAFDMRGWHASCGGSNDRRASTVVYYKNPQTPLEEAGGRKRSSKMTLPKYDPHWLANESRSEKRQHWLNRMDELGLLGTRQSRRNPGQQT